MNDTKGSNEKKELSFAEKMKMVNNLDEQEQVKAREAIQDFKNRIEEKREECIEKYINDKCNEIKKNIEKKVVAGDIVKKKKKKYAFVYMKTDLVSLRMDLEFKSLVSKVRCLCKNMTDSEIEQKFLQKELPIFARSYNGVYMKPAFGGFRGIFFQRFNKFTVEISKQIIERLEKDGIKFAGIVKGKWGEYDDKRPVTKKINGVLPLLYDGEFDLKFILEL